MDEKIFFMLFHAAQNNRHLSELSKFATKVSSKLFFILYCVLLLSLWWQHDTGKLILCITIPLFTLFSSLLLRRTVHRPRPYQSLAIQIEFPRKEKYSFPSNHSASASIIALTCLYCYTPLGIVACLLAIVTGLSRVISGLHYPTDILAGFVLSSMISSLYLFF